MWLWIAIIVILAFVVINAPWVFSRLYGAAYTRHLGRLPLLEKGQPGQRVLVLAPHPDDEVLACGGLIQKTQKAGLEVYIVWLTCGDGFEWDAVVVEHTVHPKGAAALELGERRMNEAQEAARILGVPPERTFFLGYPDRGLLPMQTRYFGEPYRSPLTGAEAVPYAQALTPRAVFTGASLQKDFETVLDRVKPDHVLCPSLVDAHPDHHATATMTRRVLGERGELDKITYWVIHGGAEWPLPKGLKAELPLETPPRGKHLRWEVLPLEDEEIRVKHQAILAHKTQMALLSHFMLAFVRKNELFSLQSQPLEEPTVTASRIDSSNGSQ